MKTNINIDEIKRFPTVTHPIKADDLHTPQAYMYSLRRAIVTDCTTEQRAELVKLLDGKDTAEGVTFNNTKLNRDRLHIWQNEQSRKERAAILGEGWQHIKGLNSGTEPGDLITCLDGTQGRVTKSSPESCVIEFETKDGQRLSVAGYFRYTPSEKLRAADERKAAGTMKRYTINCHYDMVISVDVIADNEKQALQLAYDKAAGMSIDGAECVGHSECVADTEEEPARLLVVFRDESQYRRARDFYCLKASEAPTAFYAEDYSDEIRALYFKENADTLDALERDLTEDLEYYGFTDYHFEQD